MRIDYLHKKLYHLNVDVLHTKLKANVNYPLNYFSPTDLNDCWHVTHYDMPQTLSNP